MLDLSRKRINRTILTLAWPAILENLMHTSVYIVDSIFIGSLGTQAFAAVGQSSMILFTVVFVFYGIGVATGAVVARNLGRNDKKTAAEAAGQGIILGTTIGLMVASLGLMFGEDLMVFLGTEPAVVARAQEYMPIVFAFSVLRLFIYTSSGILRAAGDTKTPMWITGIMNVYNIFADWVLIFGIGPFPELGITGAALATGTAYALGAALLVFKLFRRHAKFRLRGSDLGRIRPDQMRTIFRIAVPNLGEQMVMQSAYFSFMWIVTSLGTTALTAHFMTIRVEMVSFMPVFGLSMAVATVVGQSLGAERPEIAELAVKKAARIGLLAMSALGLVFVAVPGLLVGIYSPSPEVYELAVLCVRIAALELPTSALLMIYTGAMRGAGDTVSPMLISIFGAIFLRIGMMYVLVIELGLGLPGVWYGTALDWGIRLVIALVPFPKGTLEKDRDLVGGFLPVYGLTASKRATTIRCPIACRCMAFPGDSYQMRVVLQRVSSASVTIDGAVTGEIGPGLVLLLGIARDDAPEDVEYVVSKCVGLRIFGDDQGKMNRSLLDAGGEVLAISQFTLFGDTRKGRRPSFDGAAPPEHAEPLYEQAVERLREHGLRVATGRFGAYMEVSLVNDGPVTLTVESRR